MVDALPPRQRQAFILLREMKCKKKEAAKILDISENTVKFNMKKAVEKLKDQVEITSSSTKLLESNKNKSRSVITEVSGQCTQISNCSVE